MDLLRNLLLDNNVISEDNIFINRFKSSEGIAGLGEGIFVSSYHNEIDY